MYVCTYTVCWGVHLWCCRRRLWMGPGESCLCGSGGTGRTGLSTHTGWATQTAASTSPPSWTSSTTSNRRRWEERTLHEKCVARPRYIVMQWQCWAGRPKGVFFFFPHRSYLWELRVQSHLYTSLTTTAPHNSRVCKASQLCKCISCLAILCHPDALMDPICGLEERKKYIQNLFFDLVLNIYTDRLRIWWIGPCFQKMMRPC